MCSYRKASALIRLVHSPPPFSSPRFYSLSLMLLLLSPSPHPSLLINRKLANNRAGRTSFHPLGMPVFSFLQLFSAVPPPPPTLSGHLLAFCTSISGGDFLCPMSSFFPRSISLFHSFAYLPFLVRHCAPRQTLECYQTSMNSCLFALSYCNAAFAYACYQIPL